jgi:hypothetical protein
MTDEDVINQLKTVTGVGRVHFRGSAPNDVDLNGNGMSYVATT